MIGISVGLHKLNLAISVVFPIALISVCCLMFTANDSEVVDCGLEITLLSSFHSGQRECSCSRRRLTVPKLLSIIIILLFGIFGVIAIGHLLGLLVYR